MNRFSELPLCSALQNNLTRSCFTTPTPVQAQAIPPALAGRDLVATAQTGTGKTLAFVLPIVEILLRDANATKGGAQAVILSPTRELAIQIHETFQKLTAGTGLRAALVVGGMNESKQLTSLQKGAQVVIATPGRLGDFINRKLVKLHGVKMLILDEADRMLDMGFLPTLRLIIGKLPEARQTLLFSATIESSVKHLIQTVVKDPVRVSIGAVTRTAEQVDLHHYELEADKKLGMLTTLIEQDQGLFLVFARTKHGTDKLAKKLAGAGIRATRIHGGRTQGQRNQALAGFKKGDFRVLVATDVAARGIHVEGIAHVVNFDLPMVPEDFIHRVGRTGRAGARGVASTFSVRAERSEVRKIEKTLNVRLTPREVGPEIAREEKAIRVDQPARAQAGSGERRPHDAARRDPARHDGTRRDAIRHEAPRPDSGRRDATGRDSGARPSFGNSGRPAGNGPTNRSKKRSFSGSAAAVANGAPADRSGNRPHKASGVRSFRKRHAR